MDAFKSVEIERMRLGGNQGWQEFYEAHAGSKVTWDAGTESDRYTGEIGEEWKERLTCKVEGKEYVPGEKKPAPAPKPASRQPMSPLSGTANRSESPAQGGGKVKVDDQYFARLGADNASRPDHLHPSQGGKYAGFGNTPGPGPQSPSIMPTFDDVQKDPVAALTKGFGWFTTTVSNTAKTVNDGYIQPAAKNVRLNFSDFFASPLPFMLTCQRELSLRREISPNRPNLPQRSWQSKPRWQGRTHRKDSTALSREVRSSRALELLSWMRARRHSGTISPTWQSRKSRTAAPLEQAQWEWEKIERRQRHRLRSKGTIGTTGELGNRGCRGGHWVLY